jgi:hypothetical protein
MLLAISDVQGLPYAWYLVGPDAPRLREAGVAKTNVIPLRMHRVARPMRQAKVPA